jgi:hypothetical protein
MPFPKNGEVFKDNQKTKGNFMTSASYRACTRMLPHILEGMVPDRLLTALILWEQWQQECVWENRPGSMTHGDLDKLRGKAQGVRHSASPFITCARAHTTHTHTHTHVLLLLAFLALPTAFPVYRSLEPEEVVPFSEL